MMEQVSARAGERCSKCGTPLEPAEVTPTNADTDEIVLRCANGHEFRVTRHHEHDENTGSEL